MILKRVKIKNFRSIKEGEIDFSQFRCRVLVGINEAGKTNILHALRLLSDKFEILPTDKREELSDRDIVREAWVEFYFEMSKRELFQIKKRIEQNILGEFQGLFEIIREIYRDLTFKVDIISRKRLYILNKPELTIDKKWYKPKSNTPPHIKVIFNGEERVLDEFILVDINKVGEDLESYLEEIENLSDYIWDKSFHIVEEYLNEMLPSVIFWEYDPRNLLPPKVNIEEFKNDPNVCRPLAHMFILYGISEEKIGETIGEYQEKGDNSFRSFLNRVAETSTRYLKSIWKDFKDIKFSLIPNVDYIVCGVKEKNIRDMDKRSDGFKKFVSLLLALSYPHRKKLLKNSLILIDEAEASLYPSGARYLRDELIRLSEDNYLVFSTHSIFMIDRNNIERHYIVKKIKKEISVILPASEENYRNEEVLFNALGSSVYEILEEKNIIFEGYTDKKLFKIFVGSHKKWKKFFDKIGISHVVGVKSIKNITPILNLGNRKVLILTDSDQVALQERDKFIKENGWGIWKTYDELTESKVVTCEDFIRKETLLKHFLEVLIDNGISIRKEELNIPDGGRLSYFEKVLKVKLESDKKEIKDLIRVFKDKIFNTLQIKDIEEDYGKFIENLQKEVQKL